MTRKEVNISAMSDDERKEYRARMSELRTRAVKKLQRDYGRNLTNRPGVASVLAAIQAETRRLQGFRTDMAYLRMFLELETPRPVRPREIRPFKEMTLPRSTQLAFDRASKHQCSLYTPKGVGNGQERVHGFGRGS